MRFTLTPRLRSAISTALPHAGGEDADALTSAQREGSIALSEVTTISRLLREQHSSSQSAAASSEKKSGGDERAPSPVWVHELLLGAAPVLPAKAVRAPAHPALAPRLAALRAAEEDREYARMVGTSGRSEDTSARDVAEMATYRSQMGVGLNLLVSMITMFIVGAYAGGTDEEPFGIRAIVCGLALMLLAMAIEMALFMIGATRVDAAVAKRERREKRGHSNRTELRRMLPTAGAADTSSKPAGPDLRKLGHSVDVR